MLESFLNKAARLQACNFIKKRLQHRCFLVNITAVLRTAFLIEQLQWLLLQISMQLMTNISNLFLAPIWRIQNYNPREIIWQKVRKSSKIGEEQKTLLSAFAYVLTTSAKSWFMQRKLDTNMCSHLILRFSYHFLISHIVSSKSFSKSWGNSYTKKSRYQILEY